LHTLEVAKALASFFEAGDVVTLEGDLGVGKTTFTKGIAKGLEIKRAVTSPTFTIIKEYDGRLKLYHMDAYRLEFSDEDLGYDEYFYGEGVTVIEWPQFIEEYLPENRLMIHLKRVDDTKREITFHAVGNRYEALL